MRLRPLLRTLPVALLAACFLCACQSPPSTPPDDAAPTAGDDGTTETTIRGSAFYREKIRLPPDVELRVQLLDNQLADTQAAVLAQQTFRGMPGPPYAFALAYDPAKLRANGSHGLHAGLYAADGELLFVTDTRVPVTPGGRDKVEFRLTRVVASDEGGDASGGETRWQCGEIMLATRFAGENVTIRFAGTTLALQLQSSGSGAKYADTAGNTFWTKGDAAMFTLQGEDARDCKRTQLPSPWNGIRARGVALRAMGNEPSWFVEVDRGEAPRLRAELDYGERKIEIAKVQPLAPGNVTGFHGTTDDGLPLQLRLRRERCHDDMSGHPYPASAALTVGDRSFRGCAAFLDD